jgi:UDP-N-acetyl-D-glucosamine dehydrogenase
MEKIKKKECKVGVIGLGYVGLPLVYELSQSGFEVHGIDIDKEKINKLNEGKSYIFDIRDEDLLEIKKNKNFYPTNNFNRIGELDSIIICVPTPVTKTKEPDLTFIKDAVKEVKNHFHKGILIILESTTYPGTTEELIELEFSREGLVAGEDYFLCYSPERIDPGNKKFTTENVPKVLGGTTKYCTSLGTVLYSNFVKKVIPVSSPKVAEMSKLLENTFRSVNIAFINEMAMLCDRLNIDIWETIEAADTKPFGFMKFTPGPGIGGHCIPLDPTYLAWKAKGLNFYSRFIELAQEINNLMPEYVYNKISLALNQRKKSVSGARVLILGIAYKADVDDLRESPSLDIYYLLKRNGALVNYSDPYIKAFKDITGNTINSIDLTKEVLANYDCVVIATNHKAFDYQYILEGSNLIVDTRNVYEGPNHNLHKIGCPSPLEEDRVINLEEIL